MNAEQVSKNTLPTKAVTLLDKFPSVKRGAIKAVGIVSHAISRQRSGG